MTGIVLAASWVTLTALAARTPLRGAIDLALGTRLRDGDLYGPVLWHAHNLQSRCAEHPRVVAGKNVGTFLDDVLAKPANTPALAANQQLASLCRRMIFVDSDGLDAIEYAGAVVDLLYAQDWGARLRQQSDAIAFAEHMLVALRDPRNHKLISRYERVLSYLRSRSDL